MSGFDLVGLVLKASIFAQLVLLTLVLLLYFSLWYILRKRLALRGYEKQCDDFERDFWSGGSVEELYARANSGEYGKRGLVQLFLFGQNEIKKAGGNDEDKPELLLEGTRRALDIAIQHEEIYLNRHMQFLATVSGVSPYIGLLGTVWGIISAFQSLTQTSQATIALVAPGIAEALIATAMGLLAAIPALIAYNYFSTRLDQISARFDNFANHYLNLLRRNL